MKIISGMHRSGTSLVARLFHEAGAEMGDPATLYPGDRWNPDGYFEQPAFHAINMPLIHGPYGRLAYLSLPSPRTIERRAGRLREQIRSTAQAYRGRIVKDARFCLTLGAWLSQGAHIDRVALVLREPTEVARSLRRRNRIPLFLGYSLWRTHNERLLRAATDHDIPLHLVRYDLLLDPERQCDEILGAFRFMALDVGADATCRLIERVAEPSKNKSRPPVTAGPHPPAVSAMWDELRERHASQPAQGAGHAND